MNPINRVDVSQAAYKAPAVPAARGVSEAGVAVESGVVSRGRDRVELSGVQSFLAVLKANDIRAEKVADIRARIEAGTYETDDKLDIAADRLLDDL